MPWGRNVSSSKFNTEKPFLFSCWMKDSGAMELWPRSPLIPRMKGPEKSGVVLKWFMLASQQANLVPSLNPQSDLSSGRSTVLQHHQAPGLPCCGVAWAKQPQEETMAPCPAKPVHQIACGHQPLSSMSCYWVPLHWLLWYLLGCSCWTPVQRGGGPQQEYWDPEFWVPNMCLPPGTWQSETYISLLLGFHFLVDKVKKLY